MKRKPILFGAATILIVGILVLGWFLWRGAVSSRAREKSVKNLKTIALAFQQAGETGGLPPAISDKNGTALLSWRVALLPYLGQNDLYKQFKLDEPWDSEHNKKLLDKIPEVYKSPVGGGTEKASLTYYQVFVGHGAVFAHGKAATLAAGTIPDGSSNTLLVVEAGTPVPWTKPEDLSYDPNKPLPRLGGLFPDRDNFHVALCDGSVRPVSRTMSEKTLRAAITCAGGEVLGSDW